MDLRLKRQIQCMNELKNGSTYLSVCKKYKVSTSTLIKWRKAYLSKGLDGLKADTKYKKGYNLTRDQILKLRKEALSEAHLKYKCVKWHYYQSFIKSKFGVYMSRTSILTLLGKLGFYNFELAKCKEEDWNKFKKILDTQYN